MYTYIYDHLHVYTCVYIYIYREREVYMYIIARFGSLKGVADAHGRPRARHVRLLLGIHT